MANYILRLKGGPGSGFYGHKGRPGEQGGSLPRDGSASVNIFGETTPVPTGGKIPRVRKPKPVVDVGDGTQYLDSDGRLTPEGRKTLGIKTRNPDPHAKYRVNTQEYHDFVQSKIDSHNLSLQRDNWRTSGKGYAPISFNSYEEADLWLDEYTGQISDGKYENTSNTRWQTFLDLAVTVDESKPTTFPNFRHANMSFRDINWLFDSEHVFGDSGDDVRSTMSWASDDQLRKYAASVSSALNAENKREWLERTGRR